MYTVFFTEVSMFTHFGVNTTLARKRIQSFVISYLHYHIFYRNNTILSILFKFYSRFRKLFISKTSIFSKVLIADFNLRTTLSLEILHGKVVLVTNIFLNINHGTKKLMRTYFAGEKSRKKCFLHNYYLLLLIN